MKDLQKLQTLLGRTKLRIRLQLMLERATTTSVVALALVIVALFFYKSRSLGTDGLAMLAVLSGLMVLAGAVWGLLTPVKPRYVLKRLDLANHTRDALGSAFDFVQRLPRGPEQSQKPFMEAQIRQASSLLGRIDYRAASRFRVPRDLSAVGVLVLACVGFLAMALPTRSSHASIPPPEKPAQKMQIDDDLYNEAIDDMHAVEDMARHLKDKAMLDFLKEYKKLLAQLKKGQLTREEFERKYQALKKKYFSGLKQQMANAEKIKQQLHEVGKQLAKNKLTKKLGEALKKHDLDAARKELARLQKLLEKGKLNQLQRKKLAKALKKAAKLLKNKDAKQLEQAIKKQLEKLKKKLDPKKKQVAKMQQKMKELQKKIDKLNKQIKKTRDPKKRRQLQRRLANKKRSMRRMKRQFRKNKRQLEQLTRRQKQLQKQKRTLETLSRSMKEAAKNLKRRKLDAKTKAALQKLMKELQKYQRQSARGSNRKGAQMTLKQLKELLKRLRNRKGRQKGRLSDYLKRARQGNKSGSKGCSSCKGSGKKKKGKGPCPSCGGSGRTGGLKPGGMGGGRRTGGLTRNKPGGKGGKGGKKWGTGHNPNTVKGRATDLGGKKVDKRVKGKHGKGPSEAQVFKGSADKGFSSRNYRKVYVAYKKIWQKVLNQEEIPPGYRYLIQRYFRLIKPR